MDETPSPQTPDQGLNKLDLSQLQGFSFGTSWSQDKSSPGGGGAGRPERREDSRGPRRDGGGGPDSAQRRDRRDFRRPAGAPASSGPEGTPPTGAPGSAPGGAPRRDDRSGPRPGGERPRFEGGGGRRDDSRGPRQGGYQGGPGGGGGRGDFRGPPREPTGPYISPVFAVTFYPEDNSFKVLADAIRKSCRTFELFYIAKSVVEKNDRFVAVVQRIPQGAPRSGATPAAGGGEGGGPEAGAAIPAVKPAPFFISVPDGLPFESEDAAISHVLEKHLGAFFDTAEVEVEAPKGNFQVVNRCTVTGVLLAPPNYHRYGQIVAQHHAANIRMTLEAYKSKIETVRDPEVVAQWLEKMKKATRYTWKAAPAKGAGGGGAAKAAETEAEAQVVPAVPVEGEQAAPEVVAEAAAVAGPAFDSLEEARQHLLTTARVRVVRSVEQLRFPGRILESIPAASEIRRAVEGALAMQRRFPLDTANALRGRLRREHFTIFKKGSKGISYVCAVKRRFRVPGQAFAESLTTLISFIETNPMVKESELSQRLLNLAPRVAPAEGQAPEPVPAEEQEKLTRLKGDLRYLVKEGYVTEFVDGALFCPPPMVEARKREIEASDVDPENFPEAAKPAAAPAAETTAEVAGEVPSAVTEAEAATDAGESAEAKAETATDAAAPEEERPAS
jgi:hypothetical protein